MTRTMHSFAMAAAIAVTSLSALSGSAFAQAASQPGAHHTIASTSTGVRNIVLVHGMGSEGSVWRPVYDILKAKGYNVSIVPEPLSGFDQDVKATQSVLTQQTGPVVLVGHSYGGVVITTAGNDPKVKALVYIAAIQPDKGETMGSLNAKMPSAFDAKGVIATPEGYVTVTRDVFLHDVAQDLPVATADFLAATQVPTTATVYGAPTTDPAWRHKPSFGIVATEDRSVNPDLERWMYRRSDTKVKEVKAGHMVLLSQPQAVADVIVKAAQSVN